MMFNSILKIDKKSHLRIIETLKEMFKEPRFNGFIFFTILPTLAAGMRPDATLHGVIIIFTFMFLFTFSLVRFSLDL